MCGITGIVFKAKQDDYHLPQCLTSMNKAIHHRGPDDEGFLLYDNENFVTAGGDQTPEEVYGAPIAWAPEIHIESINQNAVFGFGHRRLSIIDLSPAGHQPMCSSDKKIWITFNGEVYNYLELRKELLTYGFQFQTETDTEVILNAYKKWGKDCVERFNGMWAFVIFDEANQEFFASRDRMGVKPFYYYHSDDFLAFASEQKAIVKLPLVNTGVNDEAVFDYFVLDQIEYEEEGFFKNILELPPACSFTLSLQTGDFKKWQYYFPNANIRFEPFQEQKAKEITEQLSEKLIQAVRLRLRADVPVGACLSGGIDSSAITGIIRKERLQYPLQLFTAAFNDKDIDESHWAAKMAEGENTIWHKTYPEAGELLSDLENLTYCQDIPIWSTSTYAQYRVMQLVKEKNIKVVLGGQGGDELFGGYPAYQVSYWNELLINKELKLLWKELNASGLSDALKKFLKQNLKPLGLSTMPPGLQLKILGSFTSLSDYINTDFLGSFSTRIQKQFPLTSTSLNSSLQHDLSNRLLKKYLKCEDRCSMFHSVESRVPFSEDLPLIEYAMSIPSVYKIRNGYQKYILRRAARKFIPEEIASRKDKKGYLTPNNQWISKIYPDLKELFLSDYLKKYLNTEKILKSKNLYDPEKMGNNDKVFKFFSFALWMSLFRDELNNKRH